MKSVELTDNEINRFLNLTREYKHEKPHQYEHTRIKDGKIVFILYNSKKLVFNDNGECYDLLSNILEEKEYDDNNYDKYNEKNYENSISILENYEYTIGSDETGKGEWYGPLVITSVCTSHEENLKLKEIGVTDSKKLSGKQIGNLYRKIEKLNINHETIVLTPFSYNKLYAKFKSEGKNLNHLLAYLHSKAITTLLSQVNTSNVLVIIDKFDYKKMNEYLDVNDSVKIIQENNGEKFIPVAASSIIAKYHYEKTLKDIEKRYNINLRKTKPKNIDKNIIDKVAKVHFKNVKKYSL
jgi:ribonuclease HIII